MYKATFFVKSRWNCAKWVVDPCTHGISLLPVGASAGLLFTVLACDKIGFHAATFSDAFPCFISIGWYQRDLLAQWIHVRVPKVSSATLVHKEYFGNLYVRNCFIHIWHFIWLCLTDMSFIISDYFYYVEMLISWVYNQCSVVKNNWIH